MQNIKQILLLFNVFLAFNYTLIYAQGFDLENYRENNKEEVSNGSSEINGGPINSNFIDGVYLVEKTYDTVYFKDFYGTTRNKNFLLDEYWEDYVYEQDFEDLINNLIQKHPLETPTDFFQSIYINPTALFKPEVRNKNIQSNVFFNQLDTLRSFRPLLPNSIWSVVDTSKIKAIQGSTLMYLDKNHTFPFKDYLTPFLFRQSPVTNYEYRQFVESVKDSIMRELLFMGISEFDEALTFISLNDSVLALGKNTYKKMTRLELRKNAILNKKTKYSADAKEYINILSEIYYPQPQRFYKRKEIDTRKLIYSYIDEKGDSIVIPVYPDTVQFDYFSPDYGSYPYTNMYFWHPAYDNQPVVGVSYRQVQAFLNWKTEKAQKTIIEKGLNYKITYKLPNEIQWDMVSTMSSCKKDITIYGSNYPLFSDDNWITNLHLKERLTLESYSYIGKGLEFTKKLEYQDTVFQKLKRKHLQLNTLNQGYKLNIFKIYIPKKERKNIHLLNSSNRDNSGNIFLGGIVSEWLDVDYDTQWKPVFEYRQKLLNRLNGEDGAFQSLTERYYDSNFNVAGGKLVRGSNWFDERIGMIADKNVAGLHAKCFADPTSSFATVGFRYVIVFEGL